jgi:hypothetical protein
MSDSRTEAPIGRESSNYCRVCCCAHLLYVTKLPYRLAHKTLRGGQGVLLGLCAHFEL